MIRKLCKQLQLCVERTVEADSRYKLDIIDAFIKTILCKLDNDKVVNLLNLIGVYFIRIRCEEKTVLSF